MSLRSCFTSLKIPNEDRAEIRAIADQLNVGELEAVQAYLVGVAADQESLRIQLMDMGHDLEVRATTLSDATVFQGGRHPGNIATRLPQEGGRLDAATQVDMATLADAGNLLSRMATKLRAPFQIVTRTKVGVKSSAWEGYPLLGDFVPKGTATLNTAIEELDAAVAREAEARKTQTQEIGTARARETLRKELRKELLAKAKESGEKLNKETRARVDKEAAEAAEAAEVTPASVPAAALNTAVLANTNEIEARQAEVDKAQLTVDQQLVEEFIVRAKNNILDLYKKVPKDVRERSRKWYEGAHRFANALADRWQIAPMQVAGVIAAMSPQKDWFQNASLGERVVDIWHERQDHVWDDAMEATAAEVYGEAKYAASLDAIRGQPLSAIADAVPAGMWVRVFDQTYNEPGYRILSPEGDLQGWARNAPKKGQNRGDRSRVQWGSNSEISKAIAILMDGSRENISESLGGFHKVRNFYVNILDPADPNAVTIDTHAVAAALLRPMSSTSNEVNDSFTTPTEVTSGLKGMYVLYADAYRRAAAEMEILPREMQSITWEAVKGLFTPEFKSSAAAVTIDEHWRDYANGEKTLAQTISRVVRTAGNIDLPAWIGGPAGAVDAEAGGTSYARELSSVELPGRRARPAASGTGSDPAAGATAGVTLFQGAAPLQLGPGSPAFKNWFGDSKAVDMNGDPAVWYHATFLKPSVSRKGGFEVFKPDDRGYIFIADNPREAETMASAVHEAGRNLAGQTTMPVYVKAENPFNPHDWKHRHLIRREVAAFTKDPNIDYTAADMDDILKSTNSWWVLEEPAVAARIKEEGFDSVYIWESGERNLAVRESNQLKSASGNVGTYDPANPSILYQGDTANEAVVTFETVTHNLTPQLQTMPLAMRAEYTQEALATLKLDGDFGLLDLVGTKGAVSVSTGAYDGGVNPNAILKVWAKDAPEKMDLLSLVLMDIYTQDAVPWMAFDANGETAAVSVELTQQMSVGEQDAFLAHLGTFIDDAGFTIVGADLVIANFSGMDETAFNAAVQQAVDTYAGSSTFASVQQQRVNSVYHSITDHAAEGWENHDAARKSLEDEITRRGSPALRNFTRIRRQEVEALNKRWDQRIRGVDAGARVGSSPAVRADGRVELHHWGRTTQDLLDPAFHGAGIAGEESARKTQPDWVDRTYYGMEVDSVGGYAKERTLGGVHHITSVEPERLYDLTTDPDNLQTEGMTSNAYEAAIKAAGYAGYWSDSNLGRAAAVFEALPVERATAEQFQEKSVAPMGSFNPETGVINAFERHDLSTLLHESGHAFVHMLGVIAAREDAPKSIVDNYAAMLEWVGATSADELSIELHGDAARAKQEKLAEAFESYLMAGKAPSARLRNAFAQFKQWLTQIYTRLRRLGTQVDPQIAQVFDRMLATEQEMAQHREANAVAGASPDVLELMTDAERAKYIKAMDTAKSVDEDEAARIQLEMEHRAQAEWWTSERARMALDIEEEVWSRPEYRALYFLTRGDFRTGETPAHLSRRRLSRDELLDMGLTQEQLNLLPKRGRRIYTSNPEEMLSAEELAAHLGYDSGQEMVYALLNTPSAAQTVADEANAAMIAKHGDPLNDGTKEVLQEEALYNAERRVALQAELDVLARKTGQQKVAREVTRAVVDQIFAERPVGELLTPMKYQAASVRAARAAERAIAKGDHMEAFTQKRKQMLNFELFRRGLKARDEVQKIRDKLRKHQIRKADKTVDPEHVAVLKDLLHIYEFTNISQTKMEQALSPDKAKAALAYLEAQLAAGEPIVLPGELMELVNVDPETGKPTFKLKLKHWRSMTMAELQALRDVADNVVARGKATSAEAKAALKKRADDLAKGIYARTGKTAPVRTPENRLTDKEKEKKSRRRAFFAAHRKMESMMRQLDGFENLGPMWSALFDPLAAAQDTKTTYIKDIMKDFDALFYNNYDFKTRTRMSDRKRMTAIPGLAGPGFTHEERLVFALNWGNESSRKAILEDSAMIERFGDTWNETTVTRILETLTDQDWGTVTGIWEMVNSYWSEIAALEKRTTGVAPKKVEASPFIVGGREFAGGYYPLKYDPYESTQVAQEAEGDLQKRIQSGGFARAHTTHGFTIARVGSGGRPVRLSLGVLMSHLDEVTQDLAYREAVDNAAKLLSQKSIRDAITEVLSTEHLKNLDEILIKVANGHMADSKGKLGNLVKSARINVTSAVMGLNIRTIVTQPLGLSQSITRLNPVWMTRGFGEFWLHPLQSIKDIHKDSAYMTERSRTMIRELDDITSAVQMPSISNKIKELGFKPMVFVDMVAVAYPTWLGARAKALAGKVDGIDAGDMVQAIKYADSTIRLTQSAGGTLNLSMAQQKDELHKSLTMFGSYFNSTYNMEAEALAKTGQRGQPRHFIGDSILVTVIPAVIGALILEAWPRIEDQDDDDEELMWAKWLGLQTLSYAAGQLFLVRDLVNGVLSGFDFSPSPAISLGQGVSRVIRDTPDMITELMEEGTMTLSAAKNLVRTAGMVTGIPGTNQLAKSMDYLIKEAQGDLQRPPRNFVERVQQTVLTGDRQK